MENDNNSFSQLDRGKAYFSAYQTENNCYLAFEWVSLSAHQGNMEAQFILGDLYALGQGTDQSHTLAYEWYTKSALQGYTKALVRIHNLYEDDKEIHCRGYRNDEECKQFSYGILSKAKVREQREHRLQHFVLIQNKAIKYYKGEFDTLIKKKGKNSTSGQLQLGFLYQHGYGAKRSIQKAIECYVAAANEGVSEAQYHLGEIYLKDRSLKFKYEQAFQCFSKSAESGNINAQCNLAYLYEKGIGVERSHSMALHWYTKAGNMRHHTAQISIARMYRTGEGVTRDYSESIKWYNHAASDGSRAAQNCLDQLHSQEEINFDGEALSNLGYYRNPVGGRRLNSLLRKHISYINHAQKEKQLQRLAMSAIKRDINAMYEIGIKYRDGDDLPQDDDLSLKWIKGSARGGLEKAQLIMGEMHKEGNLVEQNYHKASIWYKKRPLRKNDVFQYNLGMLYYDGNGVRKDDLEASKWFFKSADQGNNKSQFQLGFMRDFGFGIQEDKLEAFEWYMKSAYQKNGDAMCRVGLTYLTDDITQKDTSKAILWHKRALNHRSERGCLELINLYEENKSELVELKLSNFFLESPDNITISGLDNIITDGLLSYEIARCYLKGFIVEQDYYKAYHFIKKTIEKIYEDQAWISIPAAFQSDIDPNDLVNMLKLVSEKGIADLEYNVGYAYEYGLRGDYSFSGIVEANVSQAIDWYTIASNKGDSRADYRLGVIYEEGENTEKNIFTAIDFYIKAIERRNENAMYRLAHLYLRGKGIKQNFEKAYQLFRESHNMNQCCSCLFLKISRDPVHSEVTGFKFRAEISTEEDDQNESLYYSNEKESNLLSLKMLESVGLSGNVAVQYQLGCLYGDTESKDNDYSKGAYWLGLASQGGISNAHYRLALLYEEGQGVKNNYSQSLTLYQKAADKHHDKAIYRLARMYQYGLGTPINFRKALLLYKRSDGQGNEMAKKVIASLQTFPDDSPQTLTEETSDLSNSEIDGILTMFDHLANNGETSLQFDLGYYYENKQPESDYARAVKYYSMAKNSGHITATYHLGKLYELGLGVPQDYKCAANLYNIAKEGGCSEAIFRLGNLYQNGLGVNIDYKQAFDYYTEASEQGNPDAQLKLGQMYDTKTHDSGNILEALKYYTKSYLQGNDDAREFLYFLYDSSTPYENCFYNRLIKILLGYAKNEDYHLDKKIYYSSIIYARLSHFYMNGQGVHKDSDTSWHYLKMSLELDLGTDFRYLSNSTIRVIKDNAREVFRVALKQSEKNDKMAHILLGMLYLGGLILLEETKEGGRKVYSSIFEDIYDLSDDTLYNENLSIGTIITPKDYKKALQYFLKAAETGDSFARLIVGEMYHCGYGTKQNFIKAAEYYKSFVGYTAQDSIAKSYLGLLYAFGEGVDYDIAKAYNHSTRNGLFAAQTLRCGDEAIRNYKASYGNLLRSLERQYSKTLCLLKVDENQPGSTKGVYSMVSPTFLKGETEYLLGIMNEKGQGTRVNYKEAFDRFTKAIKCGNKKAENHLKLYYKDGNFIS